MADETTVLCRIARVAGLFWDFVDKRDIDKHAMAWVIVAGTVKLTYWSVAFAAASSRPGTDVAAIIAALWVPWSGVQAIVVHWYFDSRTS